MKIAIIGAKGIVGRTLVNFFLAQGHEVLQVDRDTTLTLGTAAKVADVVWIVTLPIHQVGALMKAASVMKPGSYLIHGTSIENPRQNGIDYAGLVEKGIKVGHVHFQFRPEIPLTRTLNGQNITISVHGDDKQKVAHWLFKEFSPFGPKMQVLEPGRHDRITAISQLIHMMTAVVVNRVWESFDLADVVAGLQIGGSPCRMLTHSVLRTGGGARVAAEIMVNHPHTTAVLQAFHKAVASLTENVYNDSSEQLAESLCFLRNRLKPELLKEEDETASRLARLEADIGASRFRFRFPALKNRPFLLVHVLEEFGKRGVDLTSVHAQDDLDGGCTFLIGVREMTEGAKAAEQAVKDWPSAEGVQ